MTAGPRTPPDFPSKPPVATFKGRSHQREAVVIQGRPAVGSFADANANSLSDRFSPV